VAPGLMDRLTGKKEIVGLDVGSHTLKVVRISKDRGGVEVTHLATAPTPEGALENGLVVNREELTDAITELMASQGLEGSPVATAVTDPSMVATVIQLPRSLQSTIHTSIRFEARKHVPFDVDQSVVECQVLDPQDKHNENMSVLLVAVRREVVEGRVEVLEAAGLDPVIVDVKQLATMRALLYGNQDPSIFHQTVALVRIGAAFTEITMVRNGAFVLARIVPIAGTNMDRAVMSTLSVDAAEARRLKETLARAATREELASLPEDTRQVSQVIHPVLEEIVRDIQRSFYYLASRLNIDPASSPVERLMLTGGVARMAGLDSYLATQLETNVEVCNVFRALPLAAPAFSAAYLAEVAPVFAAAVGMGLSDVMRTGKFPFAGEPESDALLVEGTATTG